MRERPYHGKHLLNAVIQKHYESSPEETLALAADLPGHSMRHDFFKEHGQRRSQEDPEGTFDWATALNDRATRAGAIEGSISTWIQDDFAGAIEALATVGDEAWSQGFFHTITRAASADTLLGNETNQKAMATLLNAMPLTKRQRWIGQLRNNLGGTLPANLQVSSP